MPELDAVTPAAEAGAGPDRRFGVIAVVAALAVETVLALLMLRFRIGAGWVLIGHAIVVAGLVQVVRIAVRQSDDTTWPMLALVSTLVAGPVGALGAIVLVLQMRRPTQDNALLAAWYDRIAMSIAVDASNRLADNVASGRTIGLAAPSPQSFESVIARGTLAERQTALGLIARKFHPAYATALQAALKSPEPVVRVQAAAVAARIRGELKARVREVLARLPDDIATPETALAAAAALEEYLGTGLLDAGDRMRSAAALDRLKAAARGLDGRAVPAAPRSPVATAIVEAQLLEASRFAEFRALRKVARIQVGGRYRVRRIARGRFRRAVPLAAPAATEGA